jgi:alkylated DNA repair dioxygenase AlkB
MTQVKAMIPLIAGLRYIPEYLDEETHQQLLAAADAQPWLQSVGHGVQMYGYRYHHATRSGFRIGELPSWAGDLAVRMWRDGLMLRVPDQMVANEYPPGAGIFAHVDQDVFGDTIASVSLGSSCVMQFAQESTACTRELLLEPRSVLVLTGEARWAWSHGIPARAVDVWQGESRSRSRRVSLTFRVMPANEHARFIEQHRPQVRAIHVTEEKHE